MKLRLPGFDFSLDGLSAPSDDALLSRRYSEWHHFTFSDDAASLGGIVNLALSDDVRDIERGRCGVSLVTHESGFGWRGTMNLFGPEEADFSPGEIALRIGSNAVVFRDGRYHVNAALRGRAVHIDAVWTPRTEPVVIDSIGGFINTLIVPRLDVDGEITIEGRRYELKQALGYHDHNWGAWDWSRDLGWSWGYVNESCHGELRREVGMVFGQVTDATRSTALTDLVLIVWQGKRVTHVFLDDAVTLEAYGRYSGDVPRVPGVVALLNPGRAASVPSRLALDAVDGEDRLHIDSQIRDAIQFLIPHPRGSSHIAVSELVAAYSVTGHIDGRELMFTHSAFAELAGAALTNKLPVLKLGV